MTRQFPLITDLPSHIVATDWTWARAKPSDRFQADWWLATDSFGRRWVVKMRGSNYAYREHVFSALAQRLGISCQSSVYLTIPRNAAPMLNAKDTECRQLALWLFQEHQSSCSSEECPLTVIKDMRIDSESNLKAFLSSGITDALDMVRGEVLGYLCGQFEPPGRLFTSTHEFVQIDNELMFSSGPLDLDGCRWLQFQTGRQCAETLCSDLTACSDKELLGLADIPECYVLRRNNNIPRRLLAARRSAKKYLARAE